MVLLSMRLRTPFLVYAISICVLFGLTNGLRRQFVNGAITYTHSITFEWNSTKTTCAKSNCTDGTFFPGYTASTDADLWGNGTRYFDNPFPVSSGTPPLVLVSINVKIMGILGCETAPLPQSGANEYYFQLSDSQISGSKIVGRDISCWDIVTFCAGCAQTYGFSRDLGITFNSYNFSASARNPFSIQCNGTLEGQPCSTQYISRVNLTLVAQHMYPSLTTFTPITTASSDGANDSFFADRINVKYVIIIVAGAAFCCLLTIIIATLLVTRNRLLSRKNNHSLREGSILTLESGNVGINSEASEKQKLLSLFGIDDYASTNSLLLDTDTEGGISIGMSGPPSRSGVIAESLEKEGTVIWTFNKQMEPKDVTIERKIGRGSFGDVFLGRWKGTPVAVKKLPSKLGEMVDSVEEQSEWFADFIKEAELMRALRHPNILQLLGTYLDPPDLCIVMEYCARGSLFQVLHSPRKENQLTWPRMESIITGAARGMAYLHMSNPPVIHRDLKSHNLLVDENWNCKVCDFGMAKLLVAQGPSYLTACGTPAWSAPEVLRNERYTQKADVFSFAIVLWECVTRKKPYDGMPPFRVICDVGQNGLRPPLPSSVPPKVAALIKACWSEKPDSRPSFSDVLNMIESDRIFSPDT